MGNGSRPKRGHFYASWIPTCQSTPKDMSLVSILKLECETGRILLVRKYMSRKAGLVPVPQFICLRASIKFTEFNAINSFAILGHLAPEQGSTDGNFLLSARPDTVVNSAAPLVRRPIWFRKRSSLKRKIPLIARPVPTPEQGLICNLTQAGNKITRNGNSTIPGENATPQSRAPIGHSGL